VVLAVTGVGWATLMNVVRISVIAIAYDWRGVDWSSGTPHEILGLVIFLITFLALVSTDYALLVVLAPIRARYVRQYGDPVTYGAWLATAWDWLQGWGRPMEWAVATGRAPGSESSVLFTGGHAGRQGSKVESQKPGARSEERGASGAGDRRLASRFVLGVFPILAFGMLAGAQFAVPIWFPNRVGEAPHNLERALALGETALPENLGGAALASFTPHERSRDDVFGNFSRTYEYHDPRGARYLVSCDFPLEPAGHELTLCYQGIGWQMLRRELIVEHEAIAVQRTEPWGFVEAEFKKPDGSAAFLVFCAFDENGTRVTPRSGSVWGDIRRTLQKQIRASRPERTYQLQVWTVAAGNVHEDQKKLARELLLGTREQFRKLVTESQETRVKSQEPDKLGEE
jgi:hypothetical protein